MIKSADHGIPTMAEFVAANDRGQCELDFAGEWLRVYHQPRFALRGQDVVSGEILVNQHSGSLG